MNIIDFDKFRQYWGFVKMAEQRLKNTINTFSINSVIPI